VTKLKLLILSLGLAVAGLVVVAPSTALAWGGHGGGFHGGGFHGGGFHGGGFHGGGFHAAPAFHGGAFHAGPAFHGGFYRGAPALRGGGFRGGFAPARPYVGGRISVPGYWDWRGGARTWIDGAYLAPPYVGWIWIAPQWVWNGTQYVWQEGYWAPPQ